MTKKRHFMASKIVVSQSNVWPVSTNFCWRIKFWHRYNSHELSNILLFPTPLVWWSIVFRSKNKIFSKNRKVEMNDFWGIFLCVRDTYTRSKAKNYNNNNSKLTIIVSYSRLGGHNDWFRVMDSFVVEKVLKTP